MTMPEEEKKPVVPTLPPPPTPPEYFPGFTRELTELGREQYRTRKRVAEATKKEAQLTQMGIRHPLSGIWGFKPPEGFFSPAIGGLVQIEEYERQLQLARQEVDISTQLLKSSEWKQQVLTTLPGYLSSRNYSVTRAEDALKYIPNDLIQPADIEWLNNTYERLKHLTNVLPEGFEGDIAEAQTKVLEEILVQPKLELRGVHHLTVDELLRSFQPRAPELPKGMTTEDVRDLLAYTELAEEMEKDVEEFLNERSQAWVIRSAQINLVRQGIVTPEAPDLTPGEFAKLMLTQPMMGTIHILDKYFSMLPRPLAASAIIGVHELFKTPDDTLAGRMAELYNYYRSMGETSWKAYSLAFNEVDMPWYMRLGIEMAFDPTMWIGFGIATHAATKLGIGLTRIGLRGIGTRIGPSVGAIESGYIAGADAVFKAGVQVVLSPLKGAFWLTGAGYGIPKTLTMMSRNFARGATMKFQAVVGRTPELAEVTAGKGGLKGLTAKDVTDVADNAIRQAIERPTEGHDLAVRAGADLLEFNYLDDVVAKRLVPEITDWDVPRLARLNDEVLNMFSGQGERITAGKIISQLGIEPTEKSVVKLVAKLQSLRDRVAKDALSAFRGDNPKDMLINMFEHLELTRYNNLRSPIANHLNQAGRSVSWVSRVADNVLYSAQLVALERRVVMPFARWQLLFANFGPANFFENMQRGFLGGGEVFYPKDFAGVSEANRLFKGLANAPYELQMAERGMTRFEMAIVDPKTGQTAVFRNGKIPLITKPLRIGKWTPGKKINIAGQDYMITDAQAYNDMWESLTTRQRAYDYQVHYMKALPEVASEEMRSIYGTISKHSGELSDIKTFTKRDAKDIERVILQDATVGPAEVRVHGDINVFEMERRMVNKELGKTFDRCTEVRAATKIGIRDEVLDGSIFKDIDGRIAAFAEAERELSIVSLQNQIDILQAEAKAFIDNPPKNLQEFLGDMQNITGHVEGVGERIHDYRRLTELRAGKLTPGKEADDFHVGSNKLLAEFMETSETTLNQMFDNLGAHAEAAGLNEAQLAHLTDLDSIARLEIESTLATRTEIARIESIIPGTPRKSRDARFWQQQRSEKASVWDNYDTSARRLKDLRLDASRRFLNSVDKQVYVPDFIPEVVTELTPNHLAYLFGVTGDDLYRGLTRVSHHVVIRPKEDFILYARNQANAYAAKFNKSAADIGFTDDAIGDVYDQLWRNLGIEPTTLAPDSPTMLQLEDIRQELNRLHSSVKVDESDMVKWKKYVNGVADDLDASGVHTEQLWAKKESAMTKAREMHELAYPIYDDANIIDESMRAVFPFWTYEAFRWKWIPRTWMRTPGTMTSIARFVDYTDGGYMPIPGTDLQINILRGSIWMGGFRRFYMRDFPEYYDAFPGMEFVDYIGRAGFFPGIHVMAPIVGFGALAAGKPELGELAPAWVKTGLSGLRALSPQHIGKILDIYYPDRFRDFQTMLTLGEMGYDADELWRKKKQGIALEPEEEKLWLNAVNKVDGTKGILMHQSGLFRIRPQEYTEVRESMRLAIEEATGVPVSVQEQIDRNYPVTGKRLSDYYSLDILQQKLLYEFETYRRWQGITTPLYPSSWQLTEVKIRDYYEALEKAYDEARHVGVYEDDKLVRPSIVELNRQLVTREIGPDQWRAGRSDIQGGLTEAGRILGESPAYKDVPKTLEERTAWLIEKNIPVPTLGPDQELLYYYYELKPEYKWDWEAGRNAYDFETYYAHIDILLESLDDAHRERLLQRIQSDWTPIERLYWQTSREYIRPYRNIRAVVLKQYTPEQIQLIRRFEVARGAEREEIQATPGPEGRKLISHFNSQLREARQRLRLLDPTLDAWINFWGITDKLMSTESKEIYQAITKQYLTAQMIR